MTTESSSAVAEISDSSEEEEFEVTEKPDELLCSVSANTYLSLPEEALTSPEKLKNAIESCKSAILSMPDISEEKKWLVRRLIELRIRLENIKAQNEEADSEYKMGENYKVVLGHHFSLHSFPKSYSNYYCDRCSWIIWDVNRNWYICSDCGYKCHMKCLSYVCRVCAHVVVSENPDFIMDICPEPENGLANQNYRCAECLAHISFIQMTTSTNFTESLLIGYFGPGFFKDKRELARLCDYTGKYYCTTCHWNSTSVIPARVILNWDFKERFVCRSSKQILKAMFKLPILKLEELNPVLFACIEELGTVKELRRQLMQIKKYLTSCKSAVEEQLLCQVGSKIHFLENEDTYCLQDLIDLKSGELISYLIKIINDFMKHIQFNCEVCKGRGFFCEFCKDKKIIFPFEKNVISCLDCQSTFHFSCWVKFNEQCPKCNRTQQRLLKGETDSMCDSLDS